jgi:biopolymer transport protein ExbD
MAMSVGANDGPMMEINTTPLIDVLLVLLIMLIITLPMMTHAIKVDMPRGGESEPAQPIEVMVDFDNTLLWNGQTVASYGELEALMQEALRSRRTHPQLHVRADRRSQYDSVAHVLAIAQRSGMKQIAIQGTE